MLATMRESAGIIARRNLVPGGPWAQFLQVLAADASTAEAIQEAYTVHREGCGGNSEVLPLTQRATWVACVALLAPVQTVEAVLFREEQDGMVTFETVAMPITLCIANKMFDQAQRILRRYPVTFFDRDPLFIAHVVDSVLKRVLEADSRTIASDADWAAALAFVRWLLNEYVGHMGDALRISKASRRVVTAIRSLKDGWTTATHAECVKAWDAGGLCSIL